MYMYMYKRTCQWKLKALQEGAVNQMGNRWIELSIEQEIDRPP